MRERGVGLALLRIKVKDLVPLLRMVGAGVWVRPRPLRESNSIFANNSVDFRYTFLPKERDFSSDRPTRTNGWKPTGAPLPPLLLPPISQTMLLVAQ